MALVQRQNHGERHAAFSTLVRRHTDRFYALAYRLLFKQGEAEDVVQEAFLRIWHRPDLWKPEKEVRFTTWFYRIVVNACYDHNKRKSSHGHTSADFEEMETEHSDPEEHRLYSEVEKALIALPERQRVAIALCFYEGLTNKEAAQAMDIKLPALQSLLMRGKDRLKARLGLSEQAEGQSGGQNI